MTSNVNEIFLSSILYLSNKEKEKGKNGTSNICKFYFIKDLQNILLKDNIKTYYEHLVNRQYIRLVIDYDNPNIISLKEIKNIFFKDFYKFISLYTSIDYKIFSNAIAISKSDNNINTRLHIIYSNIIMTIEDTIKLMKINFKNYIKNKDIYTYVDYSIYKKNFNLRLVYSPKHDGKDKLIPIINKNILNHLVTYYETDKCYIIKLI